jgi:hypothetical protein
MRASLLATVFLAAGLTPQAPTQPPLSPTGLTAAQLEDLAAFEEGFFDVDRSYAPRARAEAKERLTNLRAITRSITNAHFVLTLSQIGALADNGHTGVFFRGRSADLGRVGVRLHSFDGEFIVVHAAAEQAELLGGRLVAVDATPVAKLREVGRTLSGGVISRRDLLANSFLESPGQLHALGLAQSPDRARYAFEWGDGRKREAVLSVVSPPGGARDSTMALLSPERAPAGWRSLLPPAKTPWSIADIGETMRRQDRPDLDAIVIQLRANMDGARSISEFLDESERARRQAGRRHVILDMRMNGGGDLTRTRQWMAALPGRLPADGRVVVLTSASTFSAAISSTGYVKQAGRARVILAGEPPGDRLNFFAEGQPIALPNSGAVVLMAKERHDYRTGCRGYTDCHPFVVKSSIAVPSLDPDVPAPWTLDAYIAGRDPGFEAAAKALASTPAGR